MSALRLSKSDKMAERLHYFWQHYQFPVGNVQLYGSMLQSIAPLISVDISPMEFL